MKRVTISVDEKWWKAVRIKALECGETVSGFIQGLYDVSDKSEKVIKASKVEKSEMSQELVKPVIKVDPVKVISKVEKPVEKAAVDLRAKWKLKHPNDWCKDCSNYNKNCVCEG